MNNIQTDWPIPLQDGLEDLLKKAAKYEKWLPILISKQSIGDTTYLFSYSDLSFYTYTNKQFTYENGSVLFFKLKDTNNNVFYENIEYIDSCITL